MRATSTSSTVMTPSPMVSPLQAVPNTGVPAANAAPMVLGVALGSLGAVPIGLWMARKQGDTLLHVPHGTFWPLLLFDCLGMSVYGILSTLATGYLPGAEVAFLLLSDVILAPLLVCVVHGEVPTAFSGAGALLLAVAVIGHELAALRHGDDGDGMGTHTKKARVSDAGLGMCGEGGAASAGRLDALEHGEGGIEMLESRGANDDMADEDTPDHDESSKLLTTPSRASPSAGKAGCGTASKQKRVSWAIR